MFRSDDYLEFIRGRVCAAPSCTAAADHAHHFAKRFGGGGIGCKPHDTFVVPLYRRAPDGTYRPVARVPVTPADILADLSLPSRFAPAFPTLAGLVGVARRCLARIGGAP
jgi:hypothetical protein